MPRPLALTVDLPRPATGGGVPTLRRRLLQQDWIDVPLGSRRPEGRGRAEGATGVSPGPTGWPDGPDEDSREEPLETSVHAFCPYCGERIELLVDPGGGPSQEYVEDCEVCCRPWRVSLRIGATGGVDVELASLDES